MNTKYSVSLLTNYLVLIYFVNGQTYRCTRNDTYAMRLGQDGFQHISTATAQYSNNMRCSWMISGPPNRVVVVRFELMDIEHSPGCKSDYIKAFDENDRILTKFCGLHNPYPIITSGNEMIKLEFRSNDNFINRRGFRARVETTNQDDLLCKPYTMLSDPSGTISSSTDRTNYVNNANCVWMIEARFGHIISIQFEFIKIEGYTKACLFDRLIIYDGRNSRSPPVTTLCGEHYGVRFNSTGPYMFVSFTTDVDTTDYGFKAYYTTRESSSPVPTSPVMDVITSTTSAETTSRTELTTTLPRSRENICGGNGRFRLSLDYSDYQYISTAGSRYSNNYNCTWTIVAPFDRIVIVRFELMDIEDSDDCNDFIAGIDGSGKIIAAACGPPVLGYPVYTSGSSVISIAFRSDNNNINGRGFRARVESANRDSYVCKSFTALTDITGNLSSSADNTYYINNASCSWHIRARTGQVIDIEFEFLQLEISTDIPGCPFDSVSIYDGSSSTAPRIANLCGALSNRRYSSTGPDMFVMFQSDSDRTYLGFKATYNRRTITGDSICGQQSSGEDYSRSGTWPWIVSIEVDGQARCVGTIIDTTYILTTADCVYGRPVSSLRVFLRDDRLTRRNPMTSNNFYHSSLYDTSSKLHNIAVIALDNPVVYNDQTAPICLPEPNDIPRNCFTSGWSGRTSLWTSGVTVQTSSTCSSFYSPYSHTHELCTRPPSPGCQINRGGPLMCLNEGKFVLFGIGSFQPTEGCNTIAGFTRVTRYLNIIRDVYTGNTVIPTPFTMYPSTTTARTTGDSMCGQESSGDEYSRSGTWPWIVSIELNGRRRCAGTIIDTTYILTTADCVYGHPSSALRVFLRHDRLTRRNPMPVRTFFYPSGYVTTSVRLNIAVIILSNPIDYNYQTAPICLPEINDIPTNCYVSGWATLSSQVRTTLWTSRVTVQSSLTCRSYHTSYIHTRHLCTRSPTPGCIIDRAAPMMCRKEGRFVLFGIGSFQPRNRCNTIAGFTRVTRFLQFIRNVYNANTVSPPPFTIDPSTTIEDTTTTRTTAGAQYCQRSTRLTEPGGNLYSASDYNTNYMNNAQCIWLIQAAPHEIIVITFEYIELETDFVCAYDSISIYDGPTSSSDRIAKLCDTSRGVTFRSTGRSMYIAFISDNSGTNNGFKATYYFTGTGRTTQMTSSTTTTPRRRTIASTTSSTQSTTTRRPTTLPTTPVETSTVVRDNCPERFEESSDRFIPNGRIAASRTLSECQRECESYRQCQGFDFDAKTRRCYLHYGSYNSRDLIPIRGITNYQRIVSCL